MHQHLQIKTNDKIKIGILNPSIDKNTFCLILLQLVHEKRTNKIQRGEKKNPFKIYENEKPIN